MEIKRTSHNEKNSSTHHKTMSEQDANRLLEEITMNPNAIEKKYIDIGKWCHVFLSEIKVQKSKKKYWFGWTPLKLKKKTLNYL